MTAQRYAYGRSFARFLASAGRFVFLGGCRGFAWAEGLLSRLLQAPRWRSRMERPFFCGDRWGWSLAGGVW